MEFTQINKSVVDLKKKSFTNNSVENLANLSMSVSKNYTTKNQNINFSSYYKTVIKCTSDTRMLKKSQLGRCETS